MEKRMCQRQPANCFVWAVPDTLLAVAISFQTIRGSVAAVSCCRRFYNLQIPWSDVMWVNSTADAGHADFLHKRVVRARVRVLTLPQEPQRLQEASMATFAGLRELRVGAAFLRLLGHETACLNVLATVAVDILRPHDLAGCEAPLSKMAALRKLTLRDSSGCPENAFHLQQVLRSVQTVVEDLLLLWRRHSALAWTAVAECVLLQSLDLEVTCFHGWEALVGLFHLHTLKLRLDNDSQNPRLLEQLVALPVQVTNLTVANVHATDCTVKLPQMLKHFQWKCKPRIVHFEANAAALHTFESTAPVGTGVVHELVAIPSLRTLKLVLCEGVCTQLKVLVQCEFLSLLELTSHNRRALSRKTFLKATGLEGGGPKKIVFKGFVFDKDPRKGLPKAVFNNCRFGSSD
jgi:hypothetical protein